MTVDRKGVEILVGSRVRVFQDETPVWRATVTALSDIKTVNHPGHWVDVRADGGLSEGMMSYILEVIQ